MTMGDEAPVMPCPNEERLRLALEGAQLGLWDGNHPSGEIYWNDQSYRQFGLPIGEAMTYARFLALLAPEDQARVEQAWRRAADGREDYRVDFPITWPDGSRHWIRAVGRVYCGPDGQPVRVSGIHIDITAQKAAEQEIQDLNAGLAERIKARTAELEAEIATRQRLAEELRLFKAVVEVSKEAIAISRPDGQLHYINPAHERLFGFTLAEARARNYRDYYPPESLAVLEEEVVPRLARGESWAGELEVQDRWGRRFPLWERAGSLRQSDGTLEYAFGFMHEISERKATERALVRKEAELRKLIDGLPIGVIIAGLPGDDQIHYLNAQITRTFGYTLEDVPTTEDWFFKGYPDATYRRASMDWWFAAVETAISSAGQVESKEFHVTCKDGRGRDVIISATVLDDLMLVSLLDISARREQEEALRASEERFRLAFENANTGMCLVDLQGQVMRVNDGLCAFFGRPREEIEGRNVNVFAYPDDQALSPRYITHAVRGNGDLAIFEKRYHHRDGHLITGLIASSLVRDAQGQPQYFISQVQDITERKATEAALRVAKERAEQASRAKDDFLANMTHDLRIPLHAILGFSEMVARTGPDQAQRRQELLGTILRNGRQLLTLINDILDLSRLERGRMQLHEQTTDLHILLRDCTASFVPSAIEKGLALNLELDAALPALVRVDRQRLTQILVNLLGNAIKFTPQGKVLLKAAATPDPAAPERMSLRFTVADTGPGISAADQARVFDEFYQAAPAPSQDTPRGTGLGLAICHRLAVLMGGTIHLDSVPGEGSRFTLTITAVVTRQASGATQAGRDATGERPAPADLAPARAALGVDPQVPPVASLRELKALAATGQSSRLLAWCQQGSAAERQPAFAARVRKLVLGFDHAALIVLVETHLGGVDANPNPQPGAAGATAAPSLVEPAVRPLILAIDDETDNLRLTYEILTDQGLEMASARNGPDGLRIAALLHPDLILLDIRMIELDGYQVCELLKADPATRPIPVIFVSARDQIADKERGFAVGGVDYVTKPFDMRELTLRITNHLRLARPAATPAAAGETPNGAAGGSLPPGRSLDILLRARDQLLAELAATPDLTSLAKGCRTNRTSLQRLFQEHLGLSVFGFLREQRLQRALALLREGRHSIDSAAHLVGYASGPALSRAFKQRFGIAPGRLARLASPSPRLPAP